jgi:galactokinase/galacturonokinase
VKQGNWGDYARGAKYALQKRFKLKKGITGSIRGSLPVGGLSSSAAVLIAYVMAFAKANNVILQPMELALIASEAEREYIGLNNGLLDQACIALGKKDHLLMLDCESNNYRLIPRNPSMPEFKLGIIFSGLTRSLMQSDYNLRVAECKTAAWNVQAYYDEPLKEQKLTFLRDVDKAKFEKVKDKMPPRFARRAEHFYSEYKRVREAVSAWEMGDLEWFGKLSFESCESSIHNYECGSPELIEIYKAMRKTDGIYGGRFSGAGFKGACIAICNPSKLDEIRESITQKYLARFPQYKNSFMCTFVDTDNGARFV